MENVQKMGKLICIIIACMFLLLFTSTKVHANRQSPIRNLTINRLSSTVQDGITLPSVSISWTAPTISNESEIGANLIDGSELHEVSKYEIMLRNLSANETTYKRVATVSAGVTEFQFTPNMLKTGSLYNVAVYPIHNHRYLEDGITVSREASFTAEEVPYRIFYNAPNVEVRTLGNGMVITFDDAGTWLNYKIFYEALTDTPFKNGFDEDVGLSVVRGSDNVRSFIETSGGVSKTRLEYTLTGRSDIKAGKAYSIAVVAYDVPNDDYTVSIAPTPNIYTCATEAPFTITEQSDDYLRLSWEGLNSISSVASEVIIYAGTEAGNLEQYARIESTNAAGVEYYLIAKPDEVMYFQIKVTYSDDLTSALSEVIEYNPSISRIIPGRPTVEANYSNDKLNVLWSAFYFEDKVRYDTLYDILVTDSVEISTNVDLNIEEDYFVKESTNEAINIENTGKYTSSYTTYLTEVYDTNGNVRGYVSRDIKLNKVYYIRVVAKIITTNGEYASEPTTIAVYIDSEGNMYYPPVLAKPPLNKRYVTEDEISIGWKQSWYEVMDLNNSSAWNSEVWILNNTISFEELEDANHIILESLEDVVELQGIFSELGVSDNYIFRQMYFSDDTSYEGYIKPYAEVEEYINSRRIIDPSYSIQRYIEEINNDINDDTWGDISVATTTVDNEKYYHTNFNNLESNILYFIMIRSYREFDDIGRVYSTYPSSIICITSSSGGDTEPVPTVPILSLDSIEDISMEVKWIYSSLLQYEIRYGKEENVENAKTINVSAANLEQLKVEIKDGYYILPINDLFPETGYYVWIKAKQINGNLESAWSNALMVITTEVIPNPILPPSGIGVASVNETVSSTFLTVEWTRTQEDLELDAYEGTTIIKNISYVFEIADNIKFLDVRTVETGALEPDAGSDFTIIDKSIVRALNLKSSTRYYLRIKTRITVREVGTENEIIKDSAYSIVKIFTTTSENEYDSELGNIELELEEKTEKAYNKNEVEIYVLNDERLINDLILDGGYDYEIDFSNEAEKYTIKKFTMPLNVLKTLENRDMNIVIKLKDMSISVPAAAFNNASYQALMKSGGVESLTMKITDDEGIYYDTVEAKEITSTFNTKYGKVDINYLDKYMNVQYDITKSAYYGKGASNVKAVIYNPKTARWDQLKEQYLIGYDLVFKVGKMGKIGVSY